MLLLCRVSLLIPFRPASLLCVCLIPFFCVQFLPAAQANTRASDAVRDLLSPDPQCLLNLEGALGLGDELSLNSALEPLMLPMARAEMILQRRSGDPLIAFPSSFRRSFRDVLARSRGETLLARVVVLPVPHLRSELLLPLLRFSSGAVDIYADPTSSSIASVIEHWLSAQDPPPPGFLQPLLLKLVPLPGAHLRPL